jgi:hypothetical protein
MDIDYGSPRVRAYTEEGNQVVLQDMIDQLDEACNVALLRSAKYSRPWDATMSATCAPVSSTSGISFSDEFKAARTCTSYHHLGRGHSSSTRCSDQGNTRSSTRKGESSPMHGTSSTYTRFILE